MPVDLASKEGSVIRSLIPLMNLPSAPLKALCANMKVEELCDDFLFKRGDTDDRLVYLLSGTVLLQAQGLVVDTIEAHSESARFALAHQIPRKIDALAKGTVRFLRLDADSINNPPPLIYQEDDGYIVVEEDEDGQDWLASLLNAPLFQNLTPANLQKIIISLEEVDFSKGTVILEQGKQDDYYYLIKTGTCLLTHKPSPDAKPVKLAQIGKGNTLGEDALIFDKPRVETVTALTDVSLVRLTARQFTTLLKIPLLKYVDFMGLQEALKEGATLLDIRNAEDYKHRYLNGSAHIPFTSLKARFKSQSIDKPLIIIGNDDKTCEAAAIFLSKHRYTVKILKGGINNIAVSAENEAVFFSRGDEMYTDDSWELPTTAVDSAVLEPSSEESGARLIFVESENEILKQANSQLQQRVAKLEADKETAEKQVRILTKQVEKLTQVLDKFKLAVKPDSV